MPESEPKSPHSPEDGLALRKVLAEADPEQAQIAALKSLAPSSQKGTTRVILARDNWVRNGDIIRFQSVEFASKNPPFDDELRLMDDPLPLSKKSLTPLAACSLWAHTRERLLSPEPDLNGFTPRGVVVGLSEIRPLPHQLDSGEGYAHGDSVT